MTSFNFVRPGNEETSEYYRKYIDQVKSYDFLSELRIGRKKMVAFLKSIPDSKWDYAYADGKWTLKEVILHLLDTERIFAYRALRISRNDKTPLPGFEQDDYVPISNAHDRTSDSIIREYKAVRKATIELFRNMDEEAMSRMGTASSSQFSSRAIGFILAGHEIHHCRIINERYLNT